MTSAEGPSLRAPGDETRITLVRHGQTDWAAARKHTGRTDIPLNGVGRAEAAALAGSLDRAAFSLVLTSPLSRAAETAALAGLVPNDVDQDMVEWDYGQYDGRTTVEIRQERPDWFLWRDGAPGGESPDDVAARADRVIERVVAAEGDVCLVAHSHFLRMFTVRWLEQPYELGARIPLLTATVSVLGWERERRALLAWAR